MALYNPIYDTSPSAPVLQSDTTSYIFGLNFAVTANCYLNGVWWYCNIAGAQYNNSAGD